MKQLNKENLNSEDLNLFNLNKIGNRGYAKHSNPKWFRDSLVCWYDIKRQLATNESLKKNPTLIDFSGHNLDMLLKNFNWEGMSGVGGYPVTGKDFYPSRSIFLEHTPTKIVAIPPSIPGYGFGRILLNEGKGYPTFTCKITLENTLTLVYEYVLHSTIEYFYIDSSGIYKLPKSDIITHTGGFYFYEEANKNIKVTIEFLPEYPDALVFDGVDDYGISENLPILIDYTVIAKRKIISNSGYLASKEIESGKGAFVFEMSKESNPNTVSFEKQTKLKTEYIPTLISYQTKEYYNDKRIEYDALVKDANILFLGKGIPNAYFSNIALYQFFLFDRTLTQEEIDWVRINLMDDYPTWFNDSLVCWYDPKKLNATNESLKANPVLTDFSLNKLDLLLKNFNFEGMSGMNGYGTDWKNFKNANPSKIKINDKIITITEEVNGGWIVINDDAIHEFVIKVSNLTEGDFAYVYYDDLGNRQNIRFTNGIHLLPKSLTGNISKGINCSKINAGVTIELLPSYPNALVFDGVDDYGISENQPILTDYTVIVKRKWISLNIDNHLANKLPFGNNVAGDSAFIFEGRDNTWSYGKLNSTNYIQEKEDISILTKNMYNNLPLLLREVKDTSILNIGKLSYTYNSAIHTGHSNIALYQFFLFNRTLTPDELAWVKYNLMDSDLPKPIAKWSAKGKTNEDADKDVLKDLTGNGHDILLKNFNWDENSGYGNPLYKDALVFDGVDDYGVCDNMPIFNSKSGYTIIAKRKWIMESPKDSYLIGKSLEIYTDGAFLFENNKYEITNKVTVSFGQTTPINVDDLDISWQNSLLYNLLDLNKGTINDTSTILTIGASRSTSLKANIALYEAHIFDHDLTPYEIQRYIQKEIDPKYNIYEKLISDDNSLELLFDDGNLILTNLKLEIENKLKHI